MVSHSHFCICTLYPISYLVTKEGFSFLQTKNFYDLPSKQITCIFALGSKNLYLKNYRYYSVLGVISNNKLTFK